MQVDVVAGDFASLKAMIAASPDLARLVKSPAFSGDEKARAMKAVLAKMQAAPLTGKFVLTLAAKRRLFALADIIAAYDRLVARLKGEVQAEVISARPLV